MKTIIISEGDPCGIGPELFESSIQFLQQYSSQYRIIYATCRKQYRPANVIPLALEDIQKTNSTGIYISSDHSFDQPFIYGQPSASSGMAAYLSLGYAIKLQKITKGSIVTLPLSKEWVIQSGNKNFSGHTEYLAEQYSTKTYMMMTGHTMKVIPLTTHIPLNKVSSALQKIDIHSLIQCIQGSPLLKEPNILFCGLNPHAGENGKIGKEESEILHPIIQTMRQAGLKVSEPYPADSAFFSDKLKTYNLIIACYHDQGLIPFKLMEGKNGVNITLGLDFLRVSPDHGTAFDIAGKGIADPTSFQECFRYANEY
jgi:4-hydroxythreonine-4-phosphate dehydrogenase